MPSKIARVKPIRLRNDVADWLDGYKARSVVESLHDLWEKGDIGLKDSVVYIQQDELDLNALYDLARTTRMKPQDALNAMIRKQLVTL